MFDIPKKYQKRITKEEYVKEYKTFAQESIYKNNRKAYILEKFKEYSSYKIIKNKWVIILSLILPFLFLYIGWSMGDGFFSTLFYLIVIALFYFFIIIPVLDTFKENYIDEKKLDKSFFNRDTVLLDTNVFMASGTKYDDLFIFFMKNKIKITVLGSVFDELSKIKSGSDKNGKDTKSISRYKLASMGIGRISRLQDNGLAIIPDIGIQMRKKVYADPDIIKYAKEQNDKSILIISNDLDVKIRADQFIDSTKSNAVLGRDLVNLI